MFSWVGFLSPRFDRRGHTSFCLVTCERGFSVGQENNLVSVMTFTTIRLVNSMNKKYFSPPALEDPKYRPTSLCSSTSRNARFLQLRAFQNYTHLGSASGDKATSLYNENFDLRCIIFLLPPPKPCTDCGHVYSRRVC